MTTPDFVLYIFINKKKYLRLNPSLLLLNADYVLKRLMNNWMETIALLQEQLQHSANINILSYGEKMSAIIPLHNLLTVRAWAWEY